LVHPTTGYWGDETRRVIWARNMACMREKRIVCRVLMENSGEMRPLERTRKIWKHNIDVDLQEI